MKIGLIRERKNPPDNRVALIPTQCAFVERLFPVKIIVEPSDDRCFSEAEYDDEDVKISNNLESCDFLLGIKEVPIEYLIEGKTYFFFSHTIKKQPHNKLLLQKILEKKITLIDYEVLTDDYGQRLIAFGKFAGMVGAHNAILGYGDSFAAFKLPRMNTLKSYAEARATYKKMKFPPLSVVISGSGRVARGAMEVLHDMGFKQISPMHFAEQRFDQPVFTQISAEHYSERTDGTHFNKRDFYANPSLFRSNFQNFTQKQIFSSIVFTTICARLVFLSLKK
ncbi:MAG: hypothetical protein HC817_05005 [Saprospiraceae bacterium]|nr:hypothetical protein [Saprospiraceae bacterium]